MITLFDIRLWSKSLIICVGVGLFGCGPGPKAESIVAYEQFLGYLYSGQSGKLLDAMTPKSRQTLQETSGSASETELAGKLSVALGWQFEKVSGRPTKVNAGLSHATKNVLETVLGGEPWRIVMVRTAEGWKLDLAESKPVLAATPAKQAQ
ncbi:MAG: hypothetical protein VX589_12955 [Myxococcota bacterium]|nr:hypothetical protein [Myxococcota bacterium]